jgi:hypothetical protein
MFWGYMEDSTLLSSRTCITLTLITIETVHELEREQGRSALQI